jgi:hypothetical protein
LIIPNTYGVPVAFFGVPNIELLAAVAELVDAGALELLEPLELLELLELQPAAVSASTAAAATLSHLRGFICASFGDGVFLSVWNQLGGISRDRPAQAAVSPR